MPVAEIDIKPFTPIAEQLEARGISISTLSTEREHDPDCWHKLLEFWNGCLADETSPNQREPFTYDYIVQRSKAPHCLHDAYFIAKHDNRYIGVVTLKRPEETPAGHAPHTANVRLEYRRQGISTAMVGQAIEYAQRHDIPIIRAFISHHNPIALEMYQKLGFDRRAEVVVVEKTLAVSQ